jgi:hypothetical protein
MRYNGLNLNALVNRTYRSREVGEAFRLLEKAMLLEIPTFELRFYFSKISFKSIG